MSSPQPSPLKQAAEQSHGRPKVRDMLLFGGIATLVIFFVVATETNLPSFARIAVASLAGCGIGWLAGRYRIARIGALVLVVGLFVYRIAVGILVA